MAAVAISLLELRGLSCERDGRRLFEHIDLTLTTGQYCELSGPNGSGKSTLLRCVAGLFSQYGGDVDSAPLLYLGHRPASSDRLTPLENLRWLLKLESETARIIAEDRLEAALAQVGLGAYAEDPSAQLSAGQRRRVALARLVLSERPLWLLDEPLTALDAAGIALVVELIETHCSEGGVVLCATHQSLGIANAVHIELGA